MCNFYKPTEKHSNEIKILFDKIPFNLLIFDRDSEKYNITYGNKENRNYYINRNVVHKFS